MGEHKLIEGHHLIVPDALAVLPPPMREAVTPHVSMLLAGVVEPDFNKRFATDAEEILRLGRDLESGSLGPRRRTRHATCSG